MSGVVSHGVANCIPEYKVLLKLGSSILHKVSPSQLYITQLPSNVPPDVEPAIPSPYESFRINSNPAD